MCRWGCAPGLFCSDKGKGEAWCNHTAYQPSLQLKLQASISLPANFRPGLFFLAWFSIN